MKKILITLISIIGFTSGAAFANEPTYVWQKDLKLSKSADGKLQYFDTENSPLNGDYQIQLKNGYIRSNFSNGFFNGSFKQVENNKLIYLIDYCNSKPCGSYQTFFKDGKLAKHKNYNQQNKLDGFVKIYQEGDGRLARKSEYKNGIKDGLEMLYFTSGLEAVKSRSNFKGGKKNGEQTLYFQEGGLQIKQKYKDNVLQGLHTKFNQDGEKVFEVNYKDGAYHGNAKMFMNGNLWIMKHYQFGKLHGKWIEYEIDQPGITKQIKYFENDQEVEQKGWSNRE